MKKIIAFSFLCIVVNVINAQFAFRVNAGTQWGNSRCVQIGFQDYRYLSIGQGSTSPNYGAWGLEYWSNGLNFWKPAPTANAGNAKLHIHDEGFVGINGVATPSRTVWNNLNSTVKNWKYGNNFRLQVFGNAIAYDYFTMSDSALKENIIPIGANALSGILRLTPIEYNYKNINLSATVIDSSGKDNTPDTFYSADPNKRYGFTSQEVKRIFPNLAGEFNSNTGAVNYVGFVPLLVKGMQEQQKRMDSLKNTNDSLNVLIQNLRQEIINWKGRTIDSPADNTRLFQNNPNPFDGQTTISYYIDETTIVSTAIIEIRDIMGVLKNTLSLGDRSGIGSVNFDGSSLNMGYYIYTLKINGSIKDSKMFLIER